MRRELTHLLWTSTRSGNLRGEIPIVTEEAGMAKGRGMAKVHKVMHEYKMGKLHSGSRSGPVVKSRKQAVAIAMSEAGTTRRKRKR